MTTDFSQDPNYLRGFADGQSAGFSEGAHAAKKKILFILGKNELRERPRDPVTLVQLVPAPEAPIYPQVITAARALIAQTKAISKVFEDGEIPDDQMAEEANRLMHQLGRALSFLP